MYYFIVAGIICFILLIVFWLLDSFKITYEIQLFIKNEKNELLLIYDAKRNRFTLPQRKVAFDEIPTQVLEDFMATEYKNVKWCYDSDFHKGNLKFDRIRDDYGPAYVYDKNDSWRKKTILCYVLKMENENFPESLRKQIPFPEFYTWDEILKMGMDIQPNKENKKLIRKVLQ